MGNAVGAVVGDAGTETAVAGTAVGAGVGDAGADAAVAGTAVGAEVAGGAADWQAVSTDSVIPTDMTNIRLFIFASPIKHGR